MTKPLINRDELLSGQLPEQRRARRFAGMIESRVLYMRDETRRALEAYFLGDFADYRRSLDGDYFAAIRQRAQSSAPVRPLDLERFVPQWRMLVPNDAGVRARMIESLSARYGLRVDNAPQSLDALGLGSDEVRSRYEAQHDRRIEVALGEHATPPSIPGPAETHPAIATVENGAEWQTLPAGTPLITTGDASDSLYLVISGHFRVLADGSGTPIAEIARGEVIGEMGALTGDPRSADVVAARDSEVIRIPQALLIEVAASAPEILLRINRDLVTRLRDTTAGGQTSTAARTYAIVAATRSAPLREVARSLAATMREIGPTAHITDEEVRLRATEDRGNDLPVFTDPILTAWLAEQEANHRYVIYEADSAVTPWTRRCIRQADQVLIVADAADDSGRGEIEESIAETAANAEIELLLVHRADLDQPTGARDWLTSRSLRAHHHWRLGDSGQLGHVARMLTGTGVGLALGGGGARGAAHLGVMQALTERGVEVDVIGGTSMGALVGGLLAEGIEPEEAARRLVEVTTKHRLLDWTLPVVAFTRGRRPNEIVLDAFGSRQIEDLWRPYFAVSTDLTHAEAVVHQSGSMWTAVRASISIPGVFPPVRRPDGALLVDGGLMNTLPIDLVRAHRGVGTVIGSNVTPDRQVTGDFNYGSSISGWRAAVARIPGFRERVRAPSIVSTIVRANEVRGVALSRTSEFAAQADLIVQPPVEHFPTLDFKRSAELVAAGYEAGGEAFDAWPQLDELAAQRARMVMATEGADAGD